MVADVVLPLRTAHRANVAQVRVAVEGPCVAVAVLSDARVALRPVPQREHRTRVLAPRRDRVPAAPLVVATVAGDLRDRAALRGQEGREALPVAHIGRRERDDPHAARGDVEGEVHFAPRAIVAPPVLPHLPLALPVDLEPCGIDDEMQRAARRADREPHRERAPPARERAHIGHWERGNAEQREERADEARRRAERQMVDRLQREHARDRQVAVRAGPAAASGPAPHDPARQHGLVAPEGQASAAREGGVILGPIAEAVPVSG